MGPDYPAAHSMDTTWFAVDRDGCVGAFDSNSRGGVPQDAPGVDVFRLLTLLLGRAAAERLDYDGYWSETARVGIFYYTHGDWWGVQLQGNYDITRRPVAPLHVDSLPPDFRNLARRTRIAEVSFQGVERLQPLEYFACRFCEGEAHVAYVASDGVTVRPVPGREGEFAAFCEAMRRECPEESARLRFDGPRQSIRPGG